MAEYTLFKFYPRLEKVVSREPLGNWPTPFHHLKKLSAVLGGPEIWIKRDDLSNDVYGGNKARKLELILARARKLDSREIITAGGLGSNHILATAALTGQAGYRTIGLFFCQPVNEQVKRNLLLQQCFGTDMHFVRDYPGLVWGYLKHYLRGSLAGRKPLLLMPGGSDCLTTIGYLNCFLEIKAQSAALELPEPEAIFIAAGTGGSAAGLLAGLSLNGSNDSLTVLHAVRVVQPFILKEKRIFNLANGVLSFLARAEKTIKPPGVSTLRRKLHLEGSYLGDGYGFSTAKTKEALELFREHEGIELEECYTAKAAAALIDYCRGIGGQNRRPVIFVHTAANPSCYGQKDLPEPEDLPAEFRWCFSDEARNCRCGLQKQNHAFCAALRQPGWRWL